MSDFKVGDAVRVLSARRNAANRWLVTEVADSVVVAVNESRQAEIRYRPDRLERIEESEDALAVEAAAPLQPSPSTQVRLTSSPPAEMRDSTKVQPSPGEPIDSVVRRFHKACGRANIIGELRRRRYFLTRSQKRRDKSSHARQRRASQEAAQLVASQNL
ncbi:MAG TPA: 30S ribosomal protein S21 [Candidatus Cybelea sp.]|jgi:ribosomal protein S21|nr:30S ribosomal protein S21 [Candidatus Cybelea sp.]